MVVKNLLKSEYYDKTVMFLYTSHNLGETIESNKIATTNIVFRNET